jgi:hypothetical protein
MKKNESSLPDSIAAVERRLEIRRRRLALHIEEAREEVRENLARARKLIPYVAGIVAIAIAGFAAARAGMSRTPQKEVVAVRATTPRARLATTLLALAGTALRFATSSQGRALFHAFRSRQHARP